MTLARVRRRLLQTGVVIVFLILAGATYQGVATALERRQFPSPGLLADVGGHQLHLYCTGEGAPTVVLEAPAAGTSAAWAWVQPDLAEDVRVCSYDRAGLGWSEAGDRPFDPATTSGQLHALLARAGANGPFVFVGQGLGAALARLHVRRFGSNTAALVLVDPPPDMATGKAAGDMTRLVRLSPWLARTGVLRATRLLSGTATGLPEPWDGAMRAFLNRPDHLTRASHELAHWDETVMEASAVPLPEDLFVARVDAAGAARVAFLTSPDQAAAVTTAVRDAIEAVRTH